MSTISAQPITTSITVERFITRANGTTETFIDYCDAKGRLQKTESLVGDTVTVMYQKPLLEKVVDKITDAVTNFKERPTRR